MTAATTPTPPARFGGNVRRIAHLAWPLFVGQLSVVAFATVDTVLLGRHSAADLAALSVGAAAYVTVFVGLMGVVLALAPIVGRLYGAGTLEEAGRHVHQGVWLALGLALLGSAALLMPGPFVALAQLEPAQEARVRGYLAVLALSLPAALLFTVYRGFNNAVSRPKAVMAIQVGGLLLKLPLSMLLITGVPALGLPALGVVGCAIATALVMWSQVSVAWLVLRRDRFYTRFALWGRGLDRPDPVRLRALLRLGIPMGLGILIEVAGFALMAVFIARVGTTPVAGHQIAVNLVSMLFMLPLAIGNATGTLVAQRIGAHDPADARRLAGHGIGFGLLLALAAGALLWLLRAPLVHLYTRDAAVVAVALPILAWVALFHVVDAAQTLAAFVLRAYHVATLPMLIYAGALGGVGLGGGFVLAFNVGGWSPPALQGAPGYWAASTAGLTIAALLLLALAWRVMRVPPALPEAPAAS